MGGKWRDSPDMNLVHDVANAARIVAAIILVAIVMEVVIVIAVAGIDGLNTLLGR